MMPALLMTMSTARARRGIARRSRGRSRRSARSSRRPRRRRCHRGRPPRPRADAAGTTTCAPAPASALRRLQADARVAAGDDRELSAQVDAVQDFGCGGARAESRTDLVLWGCHASTLGIGVHSNASTKSRGPVIVCLTVTSPPASQLLVARSCACASSARARNISKAANPCGSECPLAARDSCTLITPARTSRALASASSFWRLVLVRGVVRRRPAGERCVSAISVSVRERRRRSS